MVFLNESNMVLTVEGVANADFSVNDRKLYKNEDFMRDLDEVYVECKTNSGHSPHSMMETYDR